MSAKGYGEAIRILAKTAQTATAKQDVKFAVEYLQYFGYVSTAVLQDVTEDELAKAVRAFQRTFGLKITGELDSPTLRAMREPRCGCPDHIDKGNAAHVQFLRAQEVTAAKRNRWNKQGLTYFIAQHVPGKLSKLEQERIFQTAFLAWDNVCGLNIAQTKVAKKADIIITTGRGPVHNFDGRGGTLAWAYMPTGTDQQLTMRFDLDETWVGQPQDRGILLLNTAAHEFGHLLGLGHSKRNSALMAPYYNPFIAVPQVDDDIPRIQKIYGPNTTPQAMKHTMGTGDALTVKLHPGQRLIVTCEEPVK